MNKRTDYEHQEKDTDKNYYYFTNNDIKDIDNKAPNELIKWRDWFNKEHEKEINNHSFLLGAKIYFTYQNIKYYESFITNADELINQAIKRLEELGANNIQINWGRID